MTPAAGIGATWIRLSFSASWGLFHSSIIASLGPFYPFLPMWHVWVFHSNVRNDQWNTIASGHIAVERLMFVLQTVTVPNDHLFCFPTYSKFAVCESYWGKTQSPRKGPILLCWVINVLDLFSVEWIAPVSPDSARHGACELCVLTLWGWRLAARVI